jgi:hypothetical protein
MTDDDLSHLGFQTLERLLKLFWVHRATFLI